MVPLPVADAGVTADSANASPVQASAVQSLPGAVMETNDFSYGMRRTEVAAYPAHAPRDGTKSLFVHPFD